MAITEIIWLLMLGSPFIGLIFFLFFWIYKDRIKPLISLIIFLSIPLLATLIGVAIVTNLDPQADVLGVLSSWYQFLMIISPLFIITIYLVGTVKRESIIQFSSTIIAILLALVVSSLLIIFAQAYGYPEKVDRWLSNPLTVFEPVIQAVQVIINSSFGIDKISLLLDGNPLNDGDFYGTIGRTLGLAAPLIVSALVFALSAKAGLFNIGGEGAFYIGGFTGGVIGVWLPRMIPFPVPPLVMSIIHIPLAFLCAAVLGGLFAAIPGILRAYFGAHEVITTIMLNYVASSLVFMLTRDFYTVGDYNNNPADSRNETPPVIATGELPHLLPGPLGMDFLIGILMAILVFIFLFKTKYGLEMRAVGTNPAAAENAGIPVKIRWVQAMVISGAIGAIGGAGMSIAYYHYFNPSHPIGLGFDGIAVSVLGANNPLALIFVAILFGTIKNGGEGLATTMNIPKDIISVIRGLVVLFAAAPLVFAFLFRRKVEIDQDQGNKDERAPDQEGSSKNEGKSGESGVKEVLS
ncbi:MAG: ABC transporter permease [Candidatus Odinarchaeota archaeon]